jgi:hypothetical protein
MKNLSALRVGTPAIVLLMLISTGNLSRAQRLSRDLNVDLLVNQAGYVPHAPKTCVTAGSVKRNFEVIDIVSQQVVYTGVLQPETGDFGPCLTGDFSQVTREGHYYLRSDTLRSYPFVISAKAYQPPMNLIVHYFSLQRCGASTTGYLSPCHTDDGIRMDNGKHQDVTGGWHDASDLRKWVEATIYGMIGLAKTLEMIPEQNRMAIVEELRWGNHYFLNMQEPQGYVMNYIGGDVKKHSDSNRWTDNEIGPEGGQPGFVKPNAGRSDADMLLMGPLDDRIIRTDPVNLGGQYNFIAAEAMMARIMKTADKAYADKCLRAAIQCFTWCDKTESKAEPGVIGASMLAVLELYKTTRNETYKAFVTGQARELRKLQAKETAGNVSGWYQTSFNDPEPYKNIWNGCEELIALCDMVKMFPADSEAASWKEMIGNYTRHYLVAIARKNSFGIVPFGLFTSKDPGGNRKAGDYWYRYFMQPEGEWWVGVNSNLASSGIGLLKASEVLKDPELKAYAQKQLDWIIGINPFNSSTIEGVGYNHPVHFPGSTFHPLVPVLPGAVLNGLGGDHNDRPDIGTGSWQISEYWTPMVAYTLWLMAEISASDAN